MGSQNFANTSGSNYTLSTVFGYVPEYPSDEDAELARSEGMYDEHWSDEDIEHAMFEAVQDETAVLYAAMCEVADQINNEVSRLYAWDYETSFPYKVEVELGYHEGISVAIVDRLGVREFIDSTRYWGNVWGYHATWDTEITDCKLHFYNFKFHVEKLARFMQWALENAAKFHNLQVITGSGWVQGSRQAEDEDFTAFGVEGWKWGKSHPEFKYTF